MFIVSLFLSLSLFFTNYSLADASGKGEGEACYTLYECASGLTCSGGICQSISDSSGGGEESVEINLSDKLVLKDGRTVQDTFSTPADMVNLIVQVIFVASGVVLFALIVGAGFTLVVGGDSKNTEKAKTTLTGAIAGFAIMFAAFWIMQIISLVTGANIGF